MQSYLSCARQILKRNAKNAFFTGFKASFIALAGIAWKKMKPTEVPFNIHWTFSQFKIMSVRRDDLMAIDVGRLKNKETIILPIIWERDTSRGILKGFTIVSWKIPYFVNLNSNMIELKSVSRWTRTRGKISPIIWRKQSTFDTERIGGSLSINLEKTGPVRDRSDFNEALSTLHHLHQESGEQQLRPVPFWKHQRWHQSSSSSSSWWQWSDSWWSSWQFKRKSTNEFTCKATW